MGAQLSFDSSGTNVDQSALRIHFVITAVFIPKMKHANVFLYAFMCVCERERVCHSSLTPDIVMHA